MKSLSLATGVTLLLCSTSTLTAVTVTNLNDNGPGSLRAAIAIGGAIDFGVTGVVNLTSGALVIDQPVTIQGPGARLLTVQRDPMPGAMPFQIFRVTGQDVTISGITLSNGSLSLTNTYGSGIWNLGELTVNDCVFSGNKFGRPGGRGGAILNDLQATLIVNRCTFQNNGGTNGNTEGGALYVLGTATINDSLFVNNRSAGRGAGLRVDNLGDCHVSRCTFTQNSVVGVNAHGGAIYNFGELHLSNSTLSGNYPNGGLHIDAMSLGTTIEYCTITQNGGGGIHMNGFLPGDPGHLSLSASIVAGNYSPDFDIDNSEAVISSGYNLIGSVSGPAFGVKPSDRLVAYNELRLGFLHDNGGPTPTHAPLIASPAIDAGNPELFPEIDQRGVVRPFGLAPDIGALELNFYPKPVFGIQATSEIAEERADPLERLPLVAEFLITRLGPTNVPNNVWVQYVGSASPGLDCNPLPSVVTIPAGANSTRIRVEATPDSEHEGIERLVAIISDGPEVDVGVGGPAIFIREDGTNRASLVIIDPMDGDQFDIDEPILIEAVAVDIDGYFTRVEFWNRQERIGVHQFDYIAAPDRGTPDLFSFEWKGASPGDHVLTARAITHSGNSITSPPVHIKVSPQPYAVTIRPTDSTAMEPGAGQTDPGEFTIFRDGRTNRLLYVSYEVSGTASNGVDYEALSGSVEIPAGAVSASIQVSPLFDDLPEARESVQLTLIPSPSPSVWSWYRIGTPNTATVTIDDFAVPNHSPIVSTVLPGDGQFFAAPTNLVLVAMAHDVDGGGSIASVEFFASTRSLGRGVQVPILDPVYDVAYFATSWPDPPPGIYRLRAKATDAAGSTGMSQPITITVLGTDTPPDTNRAAVVTIAAPESIAGEGTDCSVWHEYLHADDDPALCGTNTATFVIRRTGPTNSNRTVHYEIGGTARNGWDYGWLPGIVSIPAGQRAVTLVISPVEDAIAERQETVILKLRSPGPDNASYRVGWPDAAAAIILDSTTPLPRMGEIGNGGFHIELPALPGTPCRLECSADMIHWVPVLMGTATLEGIHFTDPEAGDFPARFYRADSR